MYLQCLVQLLRNLEMHSPSHHKEEPPMVSEEPFKKTYIEAKEEILEWPWNEPTDGHTSKFMKPFFEKKRNQSWRVNSGLFLLVRIYAWLLELMAMRLEAQFCQIWPVHSNVVLHNRPPQTIPWPSIGDEWRHAGDVRSMQEGFCCASLQSSVPYWRRSCWKILHPKSSQYQELTFEQRKETKHATKRQTLLGPIWFPTLVFFLVAFCWVTVRPCSAPWSHWPRLLAADGFPTNAKDWISLVTRVDKEVYHWQLAGLLDAHTLLHTQKRTLGLRCQFTKRILHCFGRGQAPTLSGTNFGVNGLLIWRCLAQLGQPGQPYPPVIVWQCKYLC